MRPRYLLASGICLVLALFLAVPAMAATSGSSGNITVLDTHGHRVPRNSQLRTGQRLDVAVTGFQHRTRVLVQVLRGTSPAQVRGTHVQADWRGRVSILWTVPAGLAPGTHLLAFTGAPPPTRVHGTGIVQVSVPNIGLFPFTIPPRHGGSGSGSGVDGIGIGGGGLGVDSESIAGSGTGSLAYTGVNVVAIILVGCSLLLAGVAVTTGSRRRRRTSQPG